MTPTESAPRWPVMLRSTHERECARLEGQIAALSAALIRARARARAAETRERERTEQLLAMKRDGFAPPAPPAPVSPMLQWPAQVLAAYREASAGVPNVVKRAMRERVDALVADGAETSEQIARIVRAIEQGDTPRLGAA